MENRILGFIGTGNMGAAIIKGILKAKFTSPENIIAGDAIIEKTKKLKDEFGIRVSEENQEIVRDSDVIFICLKPDRIKEALSHLRAAITSDKILVSIAVGVPITFFKSLLGDDRKIIRTMPNTPATVGEGMTLISSSTAVTLEELTFVKSLFACVGKAEILDESLMTKVTALTGSSPAYAYMLIDAMAAAGRKYGIPERLVNTLAAQSVLGAAKMVLETGLKPDALKDQVATPGGTTVKAVDSLRKSGFAKRIERAMDACTEKAEEISRKFK